MGTSMGRTGITIIDMGSVRAGGAEQGATWPITDYLLWGRKLSNSGAGVSSAGLALARAHWASRFSS